MTWTAPEVTRTDPPLVAGERESLEELAQPERVAEIKRRQESMLNAEKKAKPNRPLLEILGQDDDDDTLPCSFCHT